MIKEAINISLEYLVTAGAVYYLYLWGKLLLGVLWINNNKPFHKTLTGIIITSILCIIWSLIIAGTIWLMFKEKVTGLSIFFLTITLSGIASFKLYQRKID